MSAPTSPRTPPRETCPCTRDVCYCQCTPTLPETPSPQLQSIPILLGNDEESTLILQESEAQPNAPSQVEALPAAPSLPTAGDYMPSVNDVTDGECWYDLPWLIQRGNDIAEELEKLASQELDEWIIEYDRANSALDERYLDNMLSPRLDICGAFLASAEDYGKFFIERMRQYRAVRAEQRKFAIQAQEKVLAQKVRDTWAWWVSSRSGAPGKRRRLEMGLHGLNPKGEARGSGGGL